MDKLERLQSRMKVALTFDQPWDITDDLGGRWLLGTLNDDGRVNLDVPVEIDSGDHQAVLVEPRYVGDNLANLDHCLQIVVNEKIETSDGELFLIGSIRQARA